VHAKCPRLGVILLYFFDVGDCVLLNDCVLLTLNVIMMGPSLSCTSLATTDTVEGVLRRLRGNFIRTLSQRSALV